MLQLCENLSYSNWNCIMIIYILKHLRTEDQNTIKQEYLMTLFKVTIARGYVAWRNSFYSSTVNESASRFAQFDTNYTMISIKW